MPVAPYGWDVVHRKRSAATTIAASEPFISATRADNMPSRMVQTAD